MINKLERRYAPEIKEIDKIDINFPEKQNLDNGIPVYIINTGIQEVVKVEFVFNAGNWYEDKALIAKSVAKLLNTGTKSFTAEYIAERFDYFGANIEKDVDQDFTSITLYSLNKHLSNILPVFAEIIREPVFPESELALYINNKIQAYKVNIEKVNYLAKKKFKEILFGSNNPYGGDYVENDIISINRDDLVSFHNKYFNNKNCFIIISGKLDREVIKIINEFFGRWLGNEQLGVINYKFQSSSLKKHFLSKENTVQSAIRVGKILFNHKHPDFNSFRVLNTILGGYFGSRLMTNIREDKGYTYGINSAVMSLKHNAFFYVASQVGNEYSSRVISEIYKEIKRLQDDTVKAEELNLVKNYMLGNFLRSIDNPFNLAERIRTIIEFDLEKDYYTNYINTIRTIKPENILELAVKYLDTDSMYSLIVGKE